MGCAVAWRGILLLSVHFPLPEAMSGPMSQRQPSAELDPMMIIEEGG